MQITILRGFLVDIEIMRALVRLRLMPGANAGKVAA
jgi:hypothetical protein